MKGDKDKDNDGDGDVYDDDSHIYHFHCCSSLLVHHYHKRS